MVAMGSPRPLDQFAALVEKIPPVVNQSIPKLVMLAVAMHVEVALRLTQDDGIRQAAAVRARAWLEHTYASLEAIDPEIVRFLREAGTVYDDVAPPNAAVVDALRDAVDRSNEETILRRWFAETLTPALRNPGLALEALGAYGAARATGLARPGALAHAISHAVWSIINPAIAAAADDVSPIPESPIPSTETQGGEPCGEQARQP